MLFLLADHLQVWSQLHNCGVLYTVLKSLPASWMWKTEYHLKKIKDTEDTDICEKKSITDLDSVTELFRLEGPLGNI